MTCRIRLPVPLPVTVMLALALTACGDDGPGGVPATPPSADRSLPTTTPHEKGVTLSGGLVTIGVGERCVDCHDDIVAAYRTSGMHESLTLPSGAGSIEAELVGQRVIYGPTGMTAVFDVRDGHYVQRLTYVDPDGVERAAYEAQIDLVVGSGHATRSYFQVRDGRMLELPLTWYRELQGLALSPGPGFAERALRLGDSLCVMCHTGEAHPVRIDTSAGFGGQLSLGVTCERCHGPSEDHVLSGDPRTTVNPARLSPERQEQVCAQCHLSSGLTVESTDRAIADYVPGEDLAAWIGIYEPLDAAAKERATIAGHGERLRRSRCFLATRDGSRAPLTCTTCHNPHRGHRSEDSTRETDLGCLVCHAVDACHGDKTARAGRPCFTCHMAVAPAGDVRHAKVTDHWIRRTLPESVPTPAGLAHPGELAMSGTRLRNLLDPEPARDDALLFAARAYARGADAARALFGKDAESWRRTAFALAGAHLARAPDSIEALRVRGRMLTLEGRSDEALPLLEKAAAARPDTASVYADLGYAAAENEDFEAAERHLARAVALDPYDEGVVVAWARVLVELERRKDALDVLAGLRERLGPSADRGFLASEIAANGTDAHEALRHAYDVMLFLPRMPDVQTRVADLLGVLGDDRRARLHLTEALRSDPDYKPARQLLDVLNAR